MKPLAVARSTWRPFSYRRYKQQWTIHRGRPASTAASTRLDFEAIDQKWRDRWASSTGDKSPRTQQSNGKKYILPMFPYPSGALHMGHVRVYTISDVLARFNHMKGHEVIHPMGWDAFGLPAENAAIERGISPADWTKQNIAKMKEQMQAMNGRWDWDREFMTCKPEFYKHTQRIFLLLYERGLAYQAEALVNFDPVDRTVLANEQVDANGFSWRSGAKVEKMMLKQWFLRITDSKEALLDDLDTLSKDGKWPERVISQQRNWLGRSEGAALLFEILDADGERKWDSADVFTTRPDTLFGVQYLALSLTHPIVRKLAEEDPGLQQFIDNAPSLAPDTKAGYLLPDIYAKNPMSALTDDSTTVDSPIPIYVAPYVLQDYGSGAVMGVPGHDTRDHAFWRANRGTDPIVSVIAPSTKDSSTVSFLTQSNDNVVFTGKGRLTEASGPCSGMTSDEASTAIVQRLQSDGQYAEKRSNWRLRDWLISRQRYWGCPIPIIHCDACGAVPVPAEELPVTLPEQKGNQFKSVKGNPLEHDEEWRNCNCPKCGGKALRETDTMDTFMDSSWYFFRFADPHNDNAPISAEKANALLPIDLYIGGVEHAILHLLYARFISKFLTTTELWPRGKDAGIKGEPFKRLITQGMVHGRTYSDPVTGRFLKPEEVDLSNAAEPRMIVDAVTTDQKPNISFEKMSKSKYNGVDPMTTISRYGADATRAHILFQAPVTDVLEWDEEKIVGIQRWFNRVWRITATCVEHFKNYELNDDHPNLEKDAKDSDEGKLELLTHQTIEAATTALDKTFALNTLISDLIKLTNAIDESVIQTPTVSIRTFVHSLSCLLRMIAPVAPAFAEECWEALDNSRPDTLRTAFSATGVSLSTSVLDQSFPTADAKLIRELSNLSQACAVQINGKLKFATKIPMPPEELLQRKEMKRLRDWIVNRLVTTEEGKRYLIEGEEMKHWDQVVVVGSGKTVNFVRKHGMKKEKKEKET